MIQLILDCLIASLMDLCLLQNLALCEDFHGDYAEAKFMVSSLYFFLFNFLLEPHRSAINSCTFAVDFHPYIHRTLGPASILSTTSHICRYFLAEIPCFSLGAFQSGS
jgi:hypothetical protein